MFDKPTSMFSVFHLDSRRLLTVLTYAYVQTYSVGHMMNFKKANKRKCQQTKYFKERNKETRSEVETLIAYNIYILFTIDGFEHWLTRFQCC